MTFQQADFTGRPLEFKLEPQNTENKEKIAFNRKY